MNNGEVTTSISEPLLGGRLGGTSYEIHRDCDITPQPSVSLNTIPSIHDLCHLQIGKYG